MADIVDDFLNLSKALAGFSASPELVAQVQALGKEARTMGRAWSGSSLGYHANVYTGDLQPPTRGSRFSIDSGLMDTSSDETRGYSRFDPEDVRDEVLRRAGSPDLKAIHAFIGSAAAKLASAKNTIESLLTLEPDASDAFVEARLSELREHWELPRENDVLNSIVPTGRTISSDLEAIAGGRKPGPHHSLIVLQIRFEDAKGRVAMLARLCEAISSHVARKRQGNTKNKQNTASEKKHVFIGHGHSPLWKEVKEFVRDRLGLTYDEFNRVPVAGFSNKERLDQMLGDAAIALIIMTGEDEGAGGKIQPRMNVIHEAGLFQGRLGFGKAIILLEDGCEDFSNIEGLGQIRFPKGDVKAAFEQIRRVFEREGILA